MPGPSSVSFPFSIGDQVHLDAVPHLGGKVSAMTVFGGSAQRVRVRHFDAEGDSADREYDASDLVIGAPIPRTDNKPTPSAGAPPSAANPGPTATAKTQAITASVPAVHPAVAAPAPHPAPPAPAPPAAGAKP